MPNQYTKQAGGIAPSEELSSKWGVVLSHSDYKTWDAMAMEVRRDKSELFRELIRYTEKRVKEFRILYPDVRVFGITPVLDAYYKASEIAMQQERSKENDLMTAYQNARRRDGGKVRYNIDSNAASFHLKAWAKGLTVEALLEEYAKAKAKARDKYKLTDAEFIPDDLPDPEPTEQTDGEPLPQAAQVAQEPSLADWVSWQALLFIAIVAAVLVAAGALGGYILAGPR